MPTTRREFLKTAMETSSLLAMLPTVPAILSRTACANEVNQSPSDTILVVVQLAGGNDGLNTVVPYGDDLYAKNRHTLRLTAKDVLKIDAHLGFHPEMKGFARLFDDGLLTVIQGVGCPTPSESHITAMRAWQTGYPEHPEKDTGWLGRAADLLWDSGATDLPALFVGQISQPFTLNARRAIVPSWRSLQDGRFRALPGPDMDLAPQRLGETSSFPQTGSQNQLLEFVQSRTAATYAMSRKIEQIAEDSTQGEYPPFPFAGTLRTIAQLIRADVGIRIFHAELGGNEPGGFDSHANQRDNHAALLRQLSDSVAAFANDLQRDKLLDRVLLMTFSEFGRTVAENGRRGTDHGAAAPMFLVGGKTKGGLVGPPPSLSELEKGGLKHQIDFRQVYATLLDSWRGIASSMILGQSFEPLKLL